MHRVGFWSVARSFFSGSLALLALATCDAGLGPKVDVTAPKVAITAPTTSGGYYSGVLHLVGTASDDRGIISLKVRWNGAAGEIVKEAIAQLSGTNWAVDLPPDVTGGLVEGTNDISVEVADASGKTNSASVLVYIDNVAPTVLVTYPLSHSTGAQSAPQYSETLDIKGEVGDASKLASVVVTLLDSTGAPITGGTKTADGTNTWSVRYLLKHDVGLTNQLVYYYKVVATDAAGNQNSWYYTSYDIYGIIPTGKSFPTVGELATVDAGGVSTTGIVALDLANQRQGLTLSKTADFKYVAEAFPTVAFSNINPLGTAEENVLGPGSVLTGNIIPPSPPTSMVANSVLVEIYSGSIITGSSTPLETIQDTSPSTDTDNLKLVSLGDSLGFTVYLRDSAGTALPPGSYVIRIYSKSQSSSTGYQDAAFFIDSEAPTLIEDSGTAAFVNSTFHLQGLAYSSLGLDHITLEETGTKADNSTVSTTATITSFTAGAWTSPALPLAGVDATYSYKLTLVSSSGKTTSLYRNVTVDTVAPVVTINDPTPGIYSDTALGATTPGYIVNSQVTLRGTASDNIAIANLTTKIGSETTQVEGNKYVFARTFNSANYAGYGHTDNANLVVTVVATDNAGNATTGTYTLHVDQSTDKPTWSLSNLTKTINDATSAPSNLLEYNAKVLATATDDDGVDKTKVLISVDGGAYAAVSSPPGANGGQVSFSDDLSALAEGVHRFNLQVGDINASSVTSAPSADVYFVIDKNPPTLTIASPVSGSSKNGAFSITGSFADSGGVKDLSVPSNLLPDVEWSTDGTNFTKVDSDTGSTATAGTYTIPVTPSAQGNITYTLRATDIFNKVTTQQVRVLVDTTAPTLAISYPSIGTSINGLATIRGTATDSNAVSDVQYSTDGGTTWTSVTSDKYSWNFSFDTRPAGALGLTQGAFTLKIKAVDAAGNGSAITSLNLVLDQSSDAPVVTITNMDQTKTLIGQAGSNLQETSAQVQGTISDDDWVDASTIQYRVDDSLPGDTGWLTPATVGANSTLVSFSQSLTSLADGVHTLTVRASDSDDGTNHRKGNLAAVSGTLTAFYFAVDKSNPVVVITPPASAYTKGFPTLSGTVTDGNQSSYLFVSTDGGATYSATGVSGFSAGLGSRSWSWTGDLSAKPEGPFTLKFKGIDQFNKETIGDFTFTVDHTGPTMAVSTPAASATVNGPVNFAGTAVEAYGITGVEVAVVSQGSTPIAGDWTAAVGTYSWTYTLDSTTKTDGNYTLWVRATDAAGNTSIDNGTQIAKRDFAVSQASDKPTISLSTVSLGGTYAQNLLPGSLQISGTATDDDAVKASSLQISVNAGTTWVNVSGQPALDGNVVTWSHTFTGLTDGQYQFLMRSGDVNFSGTWPAAGGDAFKTLTIGPVNFAVDTAPPTGSVGYPAQGAYLKNPGTGKITLVGTAADASGIQKVEVKINNGSAQAVTGTTSWTYDYAIGADGLVNYQLVITDNYGKISTIDRYFTIDTTAPGISFNQPSANTTVNGSLLVAGTSSEANQMDKVYFWMGAHSATPTGSPATGDWTGWTLLGGTYNWQNRIKTTALTNGAYDIHVRGLDAAGNLSADQTVSNVAVDQTTNLPVITLTTANNALLDNTGTITGTITDDDGVDVSTLQISFDGGTTWRSVSNPGTNGVNVTFSHALAAGAGLAERSAAYNVLVKVNDIGESFADTSQNIPAVTGTSSAIAIKKDDAFPVGSVTSLDNGLGPVASLQGSYISDKLTLTGTASDAVGVSTVEARLVGVGAGTFVSVTDTGTAFSTWSWAQTGLSIAGSSVSLEVRVTDLNGRQTLQSYTILVDTTKPTVGFDSTALNPDTLTGAYNGTTTFRGSSADNVQVGKVYYKFAAADPGAPDSSFTGWTLAGSTYSWTAAFNTTTVNNTAVDLAYALWAVSADGAGNVSTRQSLAFTINQGSDRPVIAMTAPTASQVFDVNAKAQGTVTDDDGLSTVEVRIDRNNDGDFLDANESYVAVDLPATVAGKSINLQHVLSTLADGSYKLQVRTRDTNFVSTGATPFNEDETAVLSFSIDTAPPALSLTKITVPDRYGQAADRVITSSFNGTYVNNDMTFQFAASDASGLASMLVSTNGSTWSAATLQSPGVYTFALGADVPGHSFDGTQNIQFKATDNNGKITTSLVTIIVDTVEPVIGFTSPSSMTTSLAADAPNVNGTVTVMGTVSDSSALSSVVLTGGKLNQVLTNLGNNLGWKVTFDSTTFSGDATKTTESPAASNIWRLPVVAIATDIAGNKSQAANSTGYIDIDPNSDKPIVTVGAPANGGSVSGSFLVSGSATDDDGINTVRLQVDLNNDGLYGASGGFPGYVDLNGDGNHTGDFEDETVYKTVAVTNGAWSILMNTISELNKSNLVTRGLATANGNIGFMVTPLDINGLLGSPQTLSVYIDATAPTIWGLKTDGTTQTVSPTPATGTLQKGTLTVRALFKDDQSIAASSLQISLDGGSNFQTVSAAGGTVSADVGAGNPFTYRVSIPINTASAVSGGTGDLQISLKVTDQTFKQTTSSLTYHVDNTMPTIAWDTPAQLPAPQGSTYSFFGALPGAGSITNNQVYGQIADAGSISGVDHVNVYFVKGTNFINPKTGALTPVVNSVSSDLLYDQAGTLATGVPFTEDIFRSVSIPAAKVDVTNDKLLATVTFASDGSLVSFTGSSLPAPLVAGTKYYLVNVNASDFQVSASSGGAAINLTTSGSDFTLWYETATSTVGSHYGISIDSRTELGSFDANASLGDGDGFQESLKSRSGYDEWYAYFDSTKLPDGPVTVYFVAYDQAGNKRYGTAGGQVTNNPPSITAATVNGSTTTSWKVKTGVALNASMNVVLTATDIGTGANIASTGWRLDVLGRYGNGADVAGSADTTYSGWYYGSGGVRDFTIKGSGSTLPVTATVPIYPNGGVTGQESSFSNGYWYKLRGTATDLDGNIATQDFYLRINNADSLRPTVKTSTLIDDKFDDFQQSSLIDGHIDEVDTIQYGAAVSTVTNASTLTAAALINNNFLKPGWTLVDTTNGQTRTISTFAATTGQLGVSSAFSPAPLVGDVLVVNNPALISGTVKLTGKAFDDTDVSSVMVRLSIDGGATFTDLGTATMTNKIGDAVTGYTYDWSYIWDSSTVTGVSRANVILGAYAADTGGYGTLATKGMDVVPYIKSVATLLSAGDALNPSVYGRSSLGSYSVRSDETLTIDGYNFNGASTVVTANGVPQTVTNVVTKSQILATLGSYVVTPAFASSTFTTAVAHNLTPNAKIRFAATTMPTGLTAGTVYFVKGGSSLTATSFQITATAGGAVQTFSSNGTSVVVVSGTGELTARVNGVNSLNNQNSNLQTQNREANNINNNLLTDDRTLTVWNVTSVLNTGDVRNLDMEIFGNTLNFGAGFSDTNFATFRNVVGTSATPDLLRSSYTRYFDNKIAFNTSGTLLSVSQCADSLNVPVAAFSSPSHFALAWAQPATVNDYGNVNRSGVIYLESNWNGAQLNNLTRVQWPDIKVSGNNTLTKVYLTYYDATQKLLKFRYGEIGTAGSITAGLTNTTNISATISSTFQAYAATALSPGAPEQSVTIFTGGYNQGYVPIAGANANSAYSAVGFTSTGTAVVAWYDAVAGNLKLKYNAAPATSYSAFQAFTSRTATVPAAGTYTFKLSVDGTLVNSGNDLSVTVANPAQGDRKHELAYQLNLLLSNGYNAYAEVDPVTNKVTVRTMNTGSSRTILLSAPTAGLSLLTAMTGGIGTAVVGAGSAWVEKVIDSDKAGKNVSLAIDGADGIHLSYQNTSFGDLRYAYQPSTAGVPSGTATVVKVDTYLQTGLYSDISTVVEDTNGDGDTEIVPYITYFNMANADTPYSQRFARLRTDSINTGADPSPTALSDGASADKFVGTWEVMSIPAIKAPKQFRVNSGITTAGDLYVGYQVDDTINPIEYQQLR